ncbi:uroporphyrinogen-III synthase [Evansella vedderi]|uniref:Uroporphyrinogen-III synthase n=1 Tax=Evansella vedderi TaxID=38282 RepID=A0ABT9ZZ20_9BACI|nr:uroporphyrinogen-III synthase [Evansella vedderi]MDQ0256487.1 uroporphyrinogen-III synthase [Evansella vedderi]
MNGPLQGLQILNTRAEHQASSLTQKLENYGGTVIEVPLISMERTRSIQPVYEAIHSLHNYHWIVFTSANSVIFFFDTLRELGLGKSTLEHLKIAAVGSKTKKVIEEKGFSIQLVPEIFDGEHLSASLLKVLKENERVLFPRSHLSRDILTKELKKANIEIDNPIVYETQLNFSKKDQLNDLLEKEQIDLIIFTSPSTVQSFFQQVEKRILEKSVQKLQFAVIGSITAKALRDAGIDKMIEPEEYTIEGLVHEIVVRQVGKRK